MRVLWYPKRWKELKADPSVIYITSNRMRAFNFHDSVSSLSGMQSDLVGVTTHSPKPFAYDAVVFQKVLDRRLAFMLRQSGITTVLDACDALHLPAHLPLTLSALITSNEELAEHFRNQSLGIPVIVVEDAHEANPEFHKVHKAKDRLLVTTYGTPDTAEWSIRAIEPVLKTLPWIDFRCAAGSNAKTDYWKSVKYNDPAIDFHMDRKSAWRRPLSWQNFILSSDIGVVPPAEPRPRSHHKALNYMAYGIPVVCYPSPAHKSLIRHGETGFFASNDHEWRAALETLRDPAVRARMGEKARQEVMEKYSVESMGQKYANVLGSLRRTDMERRSLMQRIVHRISKIASKGLRV